MESFVVVLFYVLIGFSYCSEYQIVNTNLEDLSVKVHSSYRERRSAQNEAAQTTNTTNQDTLIDDDTSAALDPLNASLGSDENPFSGSDIHHDLHEYYKSAVRSERMDLWEELDVDNSELQLSTNHRLAMIIKLGFNFPFYGHNIKSVVLATGGFIYMSPFLHKYLTATQYIAPLMANFDPSVHSGSHVLHKLFPATAQSPAKFVAEWRDVILQDQKKTNNETAHFQFQAHLLENGSIIFVYKKVPIPVPKIKRSGHPVKVGLSDAFYDDTMKSSIKVRTITEYHKVNISMNMVQDGVAIVFTPLPTCNTLRDCESCTLHIGVNFTCRWCNKIGRCSNGLDWYRQHWLKRGCNDTLIKLKECVDLPAPKHPVPDPHDTSALFDDVCPKGKCKKKSSTPVVVIVIVVMLVLGVVVAAVGWVYYAYTHPTSRSGMWLIEHRPKQMKAKIMFWKSSTDSSAKYKTESTA